MEEEPNTSGNSNSFPASYALEYTKILSFSSTFHVVNIDLCIKNIDINTWAEDNHCFKLSFVILDICLLQDFIPPRKNGHKMT